MLSTGLDIVEIARIRAARERWGERFLEHVFTETERAVYRARVSELAVRFAAKEAVMKALGTGNRGIAWREIEVLSNRRGQPQVYLRGRARERAEQLGLTEWAVSLSHEGGLALASVVASTSDVP
ncbi:MAG: holo-ACP synthase [Chloroflexi bacterium]|nr:holo-ACP synthase [Chloroflexota bacterium]